MGPFQINDKKSYNFHAKMTQFPENDCFCCIKKREPDKGGKPLAYSLFQMADVAVGGMSGEVMLADAQVTWWSAEQVKTRANAGASHKVKLQH